MIWKKFDYNSTLANEILYYIINMQGGACPNADELRIGVLNL